MKVSNDGIANDGPSATDNIGRDVEQLLGTSTPTDSPVGPAGPPSPRAPETTPSSAARATTASRQLSSRDSGDNSEAFFAFGKDSVSCGGGQDFVLADEDDVLASDCEAVGRPLSTPTPEFRYELVGSAGPDFMVVPYGWYPARFHGRGDDDRIETYGGGVVDGGAGNDRLRSGAGT